LASIGKPQERGGKKTSGVVLEERKKKRKNRPGPGNCKRNELLNNRGGGEWRTSEAGVIWTEVIHNVANGPKSITPEKKKKREMQRSGWGKVLGAGRFGGKKKDAKNRYPPGTGEKVFYKPRIFSKKRQRSLRME